MWSIVVREGGFTVLLRSSIFFGPFNWIIYFLGIGEFHLGKVIVTCGGKYLEESDVKNVLFKNEIQFV